nr:GSTsigma1f protein [Diaphanosoma celebensis]
MVQYKLYYFNLRARGELTRLIFHYAGVPFEDIRIERNVEWPKRKHEFPFHQVPVLEADGKVLAQSNSIARYLAKQFGIAGKDDWEQAQADMYVDCISDLMTAIHKVIMETDAKKRAFMTEEYLSNTIAPHVQIIEKHLEKTGSGYMVGTEITWADLAYYGFFSYLSENCGDVLKNAPHLKALVSKVANIPSIKNWVDIRPKTYL